MWTRKIKINYEEYVISILDVYNENEGRNKNNDKNEQTLLWLLLCAHNVPDLTFHLKL